VAHLPPVSTLFAAFLGVNPMKHLLGASVLAHLPAGHAAILEGRSFFPNLISGPFHNGLHTAFDFSIGASLVAAGASWLRGGKYMYRDAHSDDLVMVAEPVAADGLLSSADDNGSEVTLGSSPEGISP
jgi:hypothetical protein